MLQNDRRAKPKLQPWMPPRTGIGHHLRHQQPGLTWHWGESWKVRGWSIVARIQSEISRSVEPHSLFSAWNVEVCEHKSMSSKHQGGSPTVSHGPLRNGGVNGA